MRVRLDWVAAEVRNVVQPADLGVPTVFHYSIPVLDQTGDGQYEDPSEIGSGKTLLQGGEVMVSKLNPRKSRVLVARAHDIPTVCSSEFIVLRPRAIRTRFLGYFLLAESTRQQLDSRVQSVTRSQQRVRPEEITKIWLELPTDQAQEAIADYLDAETARIDELIAKKRHMVSLVEERLREEERALTLESSGEAVPLRWFLNVRSGDGLPSDLIDSGGGPVPVVGGNGTMGWTTRSNISEPVIAVGRVGALCGNVHDVDGPAWITDNALVLDRIRGFDRRYLIHSLRAMHLNSMAAKTAQPLITGEQVKSLRVARWLLM